MKVKTLYFVVKHKSWRDRDDEFRLTSPEFPKPFGSWTAAERALKARKADGAKCVIVFQQFIDTPGSQALYQALRQGFPGRVGS